MHNQNSQRETSEQREIEVTLQETAEQYRQLLDLLPLGVIVYSLPGSILYVNPSGLRLLGAETAHAVVNRRLGEFIPPQSSEIFKGQLQRIQETGDAGQETYDFYRLDKQLFLIEARSVATTYQGQPAVLALFRDVTEQKHIQEELRNVERLKLELAKERELGEHKERFLSLVSHEFRTPLTTILLSRDLLERYGERLSQERRGEHLRRIGAQTQYLTTMLEDVLTISRAQRQGMGFNPVPFDLEAHCRGLAQQLQTADGDQHSLVVTAEGILNSVCIDEHLLHHILTNLLSNAIKYSPPSRKIELRLLRDHDDVIIQVIDDGIGMSETDQSALYEPFHRGSNVGAVPGTGLGMTIVKKSVEAHRGSIHCNSSVDQGTTFTIRLPVNHSSPSSSVS